MKGKTTKNIQKMKEKKIRQHKTEVEKDWPNNDLVI